MHWLTTPQRWTPIPRPGIWTQQRLNIPAFPLQEPVSYNASNTLNDNRCVKDFTLTSTVMPQLEMQTSEASAGRLRFRFLVQPPQFLLPSQSTVDSQPPHFRPYLALLRRFSAPVPLQILQSHNSQDHTLVKGLKGGGRGFTPFSPSQGMQCRRL